MEATAPLALDIQDLKYRYSARPEGGAAEPRWVIDLPRLQLKQGEQALLQGGSGSGKSTLLQLIAGLLDPTGGVIKVASQPVHSLHGARRDLFRGRHIGMIFQTFNLLHGFSAIENVMAALMFSNIPSKEHRRRAEDALSALGIERLHATPEQLSVGQQQRVAVARAVVTNPALVLADEPTASLDPANATIAMDLIQRVCRERDAALLCVSHDPSLGARFERVLQLAGDAGEVVEMSAGGVAACR